jgi:AcrR family transcriptional regulator
VRGAPKSGRAATARKREVPLSRAEVIAAALAIIDTDGAENLTIRRLADRLDVYPTAVQWHGGSKAQLLASVCEVVFQDIELPPMTSRTQWTAWIGAMALAVRDALMAHPNVAPLLSDQLQVSPMSFPLVEGVLSVLESAGFRDENLVNAYNTTIGFVFGWCFAELAREPGDATTGWQDEFKTGILHAPADEVPTLRANVDALTNQAFMLRWQGGRDNPLTDSFVVAVRVLINGLKAEL